ncbi:MAG: TPM domain-containing protein, partial [Burkholderiaceae bacterium]|nr:TPM domain-containing protein [Burkholderiaceae bacterium]
AEHAIEVVADRAVVKCLTANEWQALVDRLGQRLQRGEFEDGLTQALEEVSAVLVAHFPLGSVDAALNELPDTVVRV